MVTRRASEAEGDAGFREVFDRTYPAAQRLARRITGDAATGQDLAAEALTRLYARWRWIAERDHIDAWVMRVTTNLALGVVRRRRPVRATVREPEALDDSAVMRVAVGEALARLPRRQREVVALRYLCDLSEARVAELLGISGGSVKTHLHRALVALRPLLGGEGDEDVEVRLAVE